MDVAEIFETLEYGPAPESPAAAKAWLDDHERDFGLFIGNRWVKPEEREMMTVYNPATGDELAQVTVAGAAEVDAAYEAAREAQKTWREATDHERARVLYAIARGVQKHQRLLAVLESLDNGKPIRESRDIDIPLVARHFSYHAGSAQLMSAELPGYEPVGVVGQIIPWNFPLLMLAWKIAPALAMGNSVVLKTAPATPLTALALAEVMVEAGLPPGVVNIVTGDDETGKAMTAHPGFDKFAFTGSTEVGKIIRRVTAGRGVKLSLELGGKSPFVVFADADRFAAIEGLVDAIWFNQGEVCCAGSRLLVQESIAADFFRQLRERMGKLRVADPLDKGIDMGAVVDQTQWERIDSWVQRGVEEGATMYQPECELPSGGCFYPPTLLTDVSTASSVAQEEIFGPVLVGMTFRTPDEAVALANNTRYGLAASVWSENINLALDVATKIKAGTVWINSTNLFDAASGFGGYRESGFGREGGKEGLYEYVKPAWQPKRTPAEAPERDPQWGSHVPGRPRLLLGANGGENGEGAAIPVDRTAKLYIGGKQVRPDGNYSYPVLGPDGDLVGYAADGNRKDIRNAVEAAHKAKGWADRTPYNRAQILHYIAENLSVRTDEFTRRLQVMTGESRKAAEAAVDLAISRLFTYAAYADRYGGIVQETPLYGLVIGLTEPVGVIGIACPDDNPLVAFVSLMGPAIARGNTCVIIPSPRYPLAATDFYQILETSDLPGGVVNIVTGNRDHLTRTLVEHDDVDAMWYFGDAQGSLEVEYRSADNMKRTWVNFGRERDWSSPVEGEGREFLRHATEVKNIWTPMGE
ncbi:MAG: aldehyde dehydrogenase family protein [Candidatus Promineifilaceae bacterium]|nr:aldehyde dehydrogenase family protein [Candidatus Promineifilaceae bacterium]